MMRASDNFVILAIGIFYISGFLCVVINPLLFLLFPILIPILAIVWERLYDKPRYWYGVDKPYPADIEGFQEEAKQCSLCGRHPTSRSYHIRHVHKLKNVEVTDYFRSCKCDICISPPPSTD